jgi:uncharacterized protein (TIRG00374 family)
MMARSNLLRLGVTLVTLVFLAIFARRVEWAVTWRAITESSPAVLVLAAIVNLFSVTLKAMRWWVFLRAAGSRSFGLALRATLVGAALNNVLVANGGDAARVVFVSRTARVPSERVLATLALERLIEMVGYAVILTVAALFLRLPPVLEPVRPLGVVMLVVIGLVLVYLVRRPGAMTQVMPTVAGRFARLRAYISRSASAMAHVSTTPRFAAALVLTLAAWTLQVTTYHLTAKAAHVELPIVGTIAALLAVNLGFALRATPGNVGVFQMLFAAAVSQFGVNTDQAIAVALLIQAQQMLPVTALGMLLAPELMLRRNPAGR